MDRGRKESTGRADHPLQAGWNHLSCGAWQAARTYFEAALAMEETPEALEGLSWSAWWTDDSTCVFEARKQAFLLYRQSDRPVAAARMAIWIGIDHLDFHGAVAVARGWLRRANRLLDDAELLPEHGWLAFHEGYLAFFTDDSGRAMELAVHALEVGRTLDVPDLVMLGLGLQGAVLVADGDVDAGMALLDEAAATAVSEPSAIPISSAWTCCFLVTACEQIGDYPRAYEWCGQIEAFARRYESRYMMGFCRAHYGLLHLRAGRWPKAEKELVAAVEAYTRSRPASVPFALAALAELRRRQGRLEEAEKLLDQAGTGREALLGRARVALARGEALRAAELVERFLRRIPPHREIDRSAGLELLARAHVARKNVQAAAAALEDLRGAQRKAGTVPLRAGVDFLTGLVAAASDLHADAKRNLEDAGDRYEAAGCPFEAAEARVELARSLAVLGRSEEALNAAAAARDQLEELGAQMHARRARRVLDAIKTEADVDHTSEDESPLPTLTSREREVLCIIAEGCTNREIADNLCISEHTVHRHVTNILRKLDLPSRAAAAAHAARAGLLE